MTPEWLDELCEEYEDSWKRTEVELISRIRQFLEPRALPQERQSHAFKAIAEIDVERDWLWWRKWLNREAGDRPVPALLAEFSRNTRIEHCCEAAKHFGVAPTMLSQLSLIECRARAAWGDNPHRNEYAQLEDFVEEWPAARHRATLRHAQASQSRDVPLHGLTEFGRQRSSELTGQSCTFGPPANRISIADRDDARFSRQQFLVQILSPEYALVTNLSQIHTLLFTDGRQLRHQHPAAILFPFQIQLVDLVIGCT